MIYKQGLLTGALALALTACGGDPTEDAISNDQANTSPVAASVDAATVDRTTLRTWVFGEGTARAIQREFLSFESAGRIAYVDPALREGAPVAKGQLLAYQQQDRPDAEVANAQAAVIDARGQKSIAEATLDEATANLELTQKTFERYETLLAQTSASQQEFDEAKAQLEQARAAKVKAERQLAAAEAQIQAAAAQFSQSQVTASESRIVSPIDGVLARLNIEQGFYFSPQQIQSTSEAGALSTVPVVIINPSAFEITVELPSFTFQQIAVGREVLIQPNQTIRRDTDQQDTSRKGPAQAPSTYSVRGEVYAVSPSVDPDTRTYSVKVRTTAGADRLQDGSFVTAWIAGPSADDVLTIPLNSTRFSEDGPYVFVLDGATQMVHRQMIELGLQGRDAQQVVSGLQEGDRIVTEGRSRIADGDRVRLVNEKDELAQSQ